MSAIRLMSSVCFRLRRDVRGSVATVAGLTIVPMTLATGIAVDYSRAALVRSDLQRATDAAALATARARSRGEIQPSGLTAYARRVMEANYDMSRTARNPQLEMSVTLLDEEDGVTVSASTKVETTIARIAGVEVLDVDASASARRSTGKRNIEVAMMLDATGSMEAKASGDTKTKIANLQKAATDFVQTMMPIGRSNGVRSRIAIIPFSQGVHAGAYAATVTGGRSTSCVVERNGAGATTDLAPGIAPLLKPESSMSCPPSSPVLPLSSDRNAILEAIAGLKLNGGTSGHIGTAWAWYTLSPAWNAVWPANAAAPRGAARKIAILMTDGANNTRYENGTMVAERDSFDKVNALALTLCKGMRDAGITIYSIGFDVPSPKVQAFLSECASTLPNGRQAFFNAADGASLRTAYDEIARQINDEANLRLSD